jgi:hypothetical protein
MFYDGTGGQNRRLEVYIRTALAAEAESGPSRLQARMDPFSCNASL